MVRPVAVTITSAANVSPDSSRIPVVVNESMRSVTTDAFPWLMAAEEVPVGSEAQTLVPRLVEGREVGVDVVSIR